MSWVSGRGKYGEQSHALVPSLPRKQTGSCCPIFLCGFQPCHSTCSYATLHPGSPTNTSTLTTFFSQALPWGSYLAAINETCWHVGLSFYLRERLQVPSPAPGRKLALRDAKLCTWTCPGVMSQRHSVSPLYKASKPKPCWNLQLLKSPWIWRNPQSGGAEAARTGPWPPSPQPSAPNTQPFMDVFRPRDLGEEVSREKWRWLV